MRAVSRQAFIDSDNRHCLVLTGLFLPSLHFYHPFQVPMLTSTNNSIPHIPLDTKSAFFR